MWRDRQKAIQRRSGQNRGDDAEARAVAPVGRRRSAGEAQVQGQPIAMPEFIAPNCADARGPTDDKNGIQEIKFDGYRVQIRVKCAPSLRTRNGLDWTTAFGGMRSRRPGCPWIN